MAELKKESETIEEEIIEMVYVMGGSITYEEAWNTSYENRRLIMKTIEKIRKKETGR